MSIIITPYLVENLESIKNKEDKIRTDSSLEINSQDNLKNHIELIHASLDILIWSHGRKTNLAHDRDIAIAGLRVRFFNSTNSSLKLLLSGYYQSAVAFIRDVLEISFLLDYFTLDDSAIERWIRNSDDNEFKQVTIRQRLDKRDNLKEQKRKQQYKLLSQYGTHATFDANRLFNNNDLLTIGPFYNKKFLENILFELTISLPHPVLSLMKFESNLSINDLKLKKDFFIILRDWWKAHLNPSLPDDNLDELDYWFKLIEST